MENEKSKLAINVFYPVIILLFTTFILSNVSAVLVVLILLSIYLNYCLFPDYSQKKSDNFIRASFFFIVLLLSFFSFKTLNINWGVLSGSKLGVVFGLTLVSVLVTYIKNRYDIERNFYNFENSDNSFEDIKLLRVVLWGILFFFVSSTLLEFFFPEFIFHYFLLILFLFIIAVTWIYAKRYNVINLDFNDKKGNKYKIGIFFILVGVYLVWLNEITFIAITLIVLGLSYIQFVTTKQDSDLQKKLLEKFSYPSVIVLFFFISSSFLLGFSTSSTAIDLIQPNEKLIYTTFKSQRDKIDKEVLSLFDALKGKDQLVESINPNLNIRIRTINRWYLKKEVELIGEFSYNYGDQFVDTIHHYKPGRYRLRDSDISKAIVKAFQLTVENYFNSYFENGTKVQIELDGAADAIPFSSRSQTVYQGEYGRKITKKVYDYTDDKYRNLGVVVDEKIDNPELAFLRAVGILDYIDNHIPLLSRAEISYKVNIFVEDSRIGPEFRRVRILIKISDVLI
ncbi:hypothetical protein [Lewinella cohaerens]|uniref:hypothetical protein n=1 Tax=Lewinella cohaerens TaxID=70995 RepID=UPI00035F698E|nr:hypothetical protein [Lewinella cohaerens]